MGDKRKRHHNHKPVDYMFHRRGLVAGDLKRKPHHHHGQLIDGIGKDDRWKLALAPVILILAILFLVPLMGLLAGGWRMGPGMMGQMMGGFTAPTAVPAAAWLVLGVFVAGFAFTGWLIISRARRDRKSVERLETPLEIAQNRYVLGEITLAEYEEMLPVLLDGSEPINREVNRSRDKKGVR